MENATGTRKPKSVWISQALVLIVIVIQGVSLIRSLLSLPGAVKYGASWSEIGPSLFLSIAVITAVLFLFFAVRQRRRWARWGLVIFLAVLMSRVALSLNLNHLEPNADKLLGIVSAGIAIWIGLLVIGLRIVFSEDVKAYFSAATPNSALNADAQKPRAG